MLLDRRDADAALGGDDPRHVQPAQIALTIAERGSAPALDRVERPWFGRLPAGSLDLAPADRPAETDDLAGCLRQVDRWRSQRPRRHRGGPAAASDDLVDHCFCDRRRRRYAGRADAGGEEEPVRDGRRPKDEVTGRAHGPKADELANRHCVGERRNHRLTCGKDPNALGGVARAVVLVGPVDGGRAEQQATEHDRRDEHPFSLRTGDRQHDAIDAEGLLGDEELALPGSDAERRVADQSGDVVRTEPRRVDDLVSLDRRSVLESNGDRVGRHLESVHGSGQDAPPRRRRWPHRRTRGSARRGRGRPRRGSRAQR